MINTVIPPQAFQIVRDRIGRILADEIDNQFQISYNPDLQVTNWIERYLRFDKTECPAVNVMLADGSYDGQDALQHNGTYKFFVDCYVNAKSHEEDPGDQRAMIKLQTLLGVCRAIIMNPRYVTLGFAVRPGFVMNRHIESLQIQIPNQKEHDTSSCVMGRLTVSVKVPEYSEPITPVNIVDMYTSVKLAETDLGYLWVNSADVRYFESAFDDFYE